MPTLDWIGKQAVIHHHREVPYRLLRCDPDLSFGDPDSGNLLIQGDNLEALKALLPYYAGQVKCIYIDPPYNTGKDGWVYSDNVSSPEIRKWLGKVVGKEGDDLCRHDKWLCMMYPRLVLLRELLSEDGVLLVSMGKDEVGNLRVMCDEIFGAGNLLEILIWQIEGNVENQEDITAVHEYILAYERKKGASHIRRTIDPNIPEDSKLRRDFAENSVIKNGPGNPASVIVLPAGFPCEVAEMDMPAHDFAEEFVAEAESIGYITREMKMKYGVNYPVRLDPVRVTEYELDEPARVYSGWQSARKFRRFIELGCHPLDDDGTLLRFFLSKTAVPTYRREDREGHFVGTVLRNMGTTEKASNELERMGVRFNYPKPVPLIQYLLSLYAGPDDLVADAFAGSGTTGEACMRLNAEDGGERHFILIDLDEQIAFTHARTRLKCIVEGYKVKRGQRTVATPGLGGGVTLCRLGTPLFDEAGRIAAEVSFDQLAAHVFFAETGVPLPKEASGRTPFLGAHDGRAVYLLFNGVMGDRRVNGGNVLTTTALAKIGSHDGPRVIYGEACRLSPERLRREGVIFRQIPYEIKVS